jgi:hypothetical protein
MPIFQLRRGVLLQGFHGARFISKPKYSGWILKALGVTVKWNHPESTVWFESSISFGGITLLRKRFMPVKPFMNGSIAEDQAKILRDVAEQNGFIYSSPNITEEISNKSAFWGAFSKWKSAGMPDAWSDYSGRKRAAATLDHIEEERKSNAD